VVAELFSASSPVGPWPPERAIAPQIHPRKTPMQEPTQEQIIHRAYELWEQAGKPDGRDQEFYHQAERELAAGANPDEKSKTFLE
jgi:hypothetical protein